MPSDEEFRELKDQVASLTSALATARRRIDDLEDGMADHIGLDWGESLVDANSPHPNISANTIESGGGLIRQDANGMQINTGGTDTPATVWVDGFKDTVDVDGQDTAYVKGYMSEGVDGQIEIGVAMNATDGTAAAFVDFLAGGIGASVPYGAVRSRGRIQLDAADSSDSASNKSLTGNTNDLDIGRSSVIVRLTANGAYDLTGMANGSQYRWVILWNYGANTITLKNESASSSAGNRYALKADIALAQYAGATLVYDTNSSRWRCVGVY